MFSTQEYIRAKLSTETRPRVNSSATGYVGQKHNPVWQSLALGRVGIQAKLAVSQPGDPYEREADQFAERVIETPGPRLQRKCACGGECPTCKNELTHEEDLPLRRSAEAGPTTPIESVPDNFVQKLGSGRPLDPPVRSAMESHFAHDFTGVRVHTDHAAIQSARDVNALAYTVGQDIVFGAGQYSPGTDEGQKLLSHELTHVVQQDGGARGLYRQSANSSFQRSHHCLDEPNPANPTRKEFTAREKTRVLFGLQNARGILSRAYMNLALRESYHLKMAQRTFRNPAITFDEIDQNVIKVKDSLDSLSMEKNLLGGTCDEPGCRVPRINAPTTDAVAFTLPDLSGILLCPFFFNLRGGALATTILHEAGHMAALDPNWAPGNEVYCGQDDNIKCGDICPGGGGTLPLMENVDAWMRFIFCVSMSSSGSTGARE